MKITYNSLVLITITLTAFLPGSLQAQQDPQSAIDNQAIEEYAVEKFPRAMILKRYWNQMFESSGVIAHFKWSMPARYGLDLNQNGIIELPNTTEYVNNLAQWNSIIGCKPIVDPETGESTPRFHVQFDASRTIMPQIEPRAQGGHPQATNGRIDHGAELPERGPTTPDHGLTGGEIDIMVDQFRQGRQYLEWEIDGTQLEERIEKTSPFNTDRRVIDECLPEGEYRVKMTARDDWDGKHASITQTVNVKDFLIVQLGDSFASGNGVPERQSVATITAIEGVPQEFHDFARNLALWTLISKNDQDVITTVWAETHGLTPSRGPIRKTIAIPMNINALPDGINTYTVTLAQDPALPKYSAMSAMHKEHYLSHRSSHAPGSRAALALERASEKTSVTFINLAMVGATVNRGMLGTYTGIETEERFWSDANHMEAQLDQLKNLIGNREVDALVMSIGGNDAGFANALAGLVARDTVQTPVGTVNYIGPTYAQIEEGVVHGNWDEIENYIRDIFCKIKCTFEWSELDGINGLAGQNGVYSAINKRMRALGIGVINTYITEYPDMTRNAQGATCNQVLNTIAAHDVPGGLEIDKAELEWSREHVLGPLNAAVKSGAELNEWTFVDGIISGSTNHGLCAPRPYNPVEFNDHVTHVPIQVPASCLTPLGLVGSSVDSPPCDGQWEGGVCTMNPVRWYRDENEGEIIENLSREGNTLMAHPNEFGYALVGAELLKKVCPDLR